MKNNNINVSNKKGIVVNDKMDKTIVVSVKSLKNHFKYKKKYISTKKYKIHDEENKYKVGDIVEIIPTRPISKGKFHKIV